MTLTMTDGGHVEVGKICFQVPKDKIHEYTLKIQQHGQLSNSFASQLLVLHPALPQHGEKGSGKSGKSGLAVEKARRWQPRDQKKNWTQKAASIHHHGKMDNPFQNLGLHIHGPQGSHRGRECLS